jgi:3',5'-cyclic AMP phosphodiesterase CpdA
VWNPIYLRTLAAVPRSLRIAAIGDSGFADPVTAEMAATMASLAPDLFLHLGDVVYRAEEDGDVYRAYERKYFAAFSPVLHRGPVYAVLGNHDLDAPVRLAEEPFFFHVFPPFPEACCPGVASGGGRLWYSIALGDVQLLLLNSQSFYGLGDLEEQTRWLQDRLSDRAVRVRVPVMHIAPYSGGLHVSDGVRIQSSWHPLFRQAGVPLVLSGHDHNYQHLEQDQVHYVVSGGGSQALYSRTLNLPGSLAFLAEPHFLMIEIDPDTIRVRVVDPAGIDRDAFEIPLLP